MITAATPSIMGLCSSSTIVVVVDDALGVPAIVSPDLDCVTFSPRALVERVASIRDSSPDFFPRFATPAL
jgi:hypothetical protein